MPEHVVLYALGLREGITADDVAASSSRPKNTLSRAINSLLSKKLISRMFDEADRRRRLLYLTAPGRKVLQETVPMLVAREDMLFGNLNAQERETLNYLLTKVILNQAEWPTQVNKP
jgi:DNA-binding MarR family transcriptional regulator